MSRRRGVVVQEYLHSLQNLLPIPNRRMLRAPGAQLHALRELSCDLLNCLALVPLRDDQRVLSSLLSLQSADDVVDEFCK